MSEIGGKDFSLRTFILKMATLGVLIGLITACDGTFEIGIEQTPTLVPTDTPLTTSTPPKPSPSIQPSATQRDPSSTPTPSTTPSPINTSPSATPTNCPPPAKWVLYTVRPNDTLFNLSQDLNLTVPQLRLANCLANDTIRIGQQLYVPFIPTATFTATFTATATFTTTSTFTPSPTLEDTATATATGSVTVTVSPTITSTP
jgi:LysM repeat protein